MYNNNRFSIYLIFLLTAIYYCYHSMEFNMEAKINHESMHHYWRLYRLRQYNGKVPRKKYAFMWIFSIM